MSARREGQSSGIVGVTPLSLQNKMSKSHSNVKVHVSTTGEFEILTEFE
jgi:hypothetical protein